MVDRVGSEGPDVGVGRYGWSYLTSDERITLDAKPADDEIQDFAPILVPPLLRLFS